MGWRASMDLWSYHTILHSSTHEPPFTLVYETNAMILIEVVERTFWVDAFDGEWSEIGQFVDLDLSEKYEEYCRFKKQ